MAEKPKASESTSESKHLKYNVIYPTGEEQEYYPMLKLGTYGGKVLNELDVIFSAIERDRKDKKRHITTFYLISPPGLGKTVMAAHIANKLNCPYQIVNCVGTMTDLDLLGSYLLIGEESMWQDGPIPSIIRATNEHKIGLLLLNELNALQESAQIGLNPLLDRQESVVLTQKNNELVKIDKDAHLVVIATMNPDVMGVNEIQDAVRDRSSGIIYMDYPSVEDETVLISKITGYPERSVQPFCATVNKCRKLKTVDHKVTRVPSTRALIDWINYTSIWGSDIAFTLTIENKFGTNDEERALFRSLARGMKVETFSLGLPFVKVESIEKKKVATASADVAPPSGSKIHDLGSLWSKPKP